MVLALVSGVAPPVPHVSVDVAAGAAGRHVPGVGAERGRARPTRQPDLRHVRAHAHRHRRSRPAAAAIAKATKGAKADQNAVGAKFIQNWAEQAAPSTFVLATRLYSRLNLADRHPPIYNVVVSNVPGPDFPLYLDGAELVATYPMGPIMEGAGLNVTVLSYMDNVDFGFLAGAELVPDVWDMADAIEGVMAELLAAADEIDPPAAAPPAAVEGNGSSAGGRTRPHADLREQGARQEGPRQEAAGEDVDRQQGEHERDDEADRRQLTAPHGARPADRGARLTGPLATHEFRIRRPVRFVSKPARRAPRPCCTGRSRAVGSHRADHREGRLRRAGGGRAGRRHRGPDQGRRARRAAGDPAQVPREHPRRPATARGWSAASGAPTAGTGWPGPRRR